MIKRPLMRKPHQGIDCYSSFSQLSYLMIHHFPKVVNRIINYSFNKYINIFFSDINRNALEQISFSTSEQPVALPFPGTREHCCNAIR